MHLQICCSALDIDRHWDVLPEALEKASGARPPTPSVLVLQNPGLPGQVLSATSIRHDRRNKVQGLTKSDFRDEQEQGCLSSSRAPVVPPQKV